LNPDVNAFQRAFAGEIRRFDEMERQLRFFTSQIEKAEIPVPPTHPSRRYLELVELKHVLRETSDFFQEAASHQEDIRQSFDEPTAPLLDDLEAQGGPSDGRDHGLNLGNVTGVILRHKMQTFERILWRSLHGNLYMNTAEIEEP
ncbi:H(+)-transporting V0 sector ATPase subunit a, partial [Mortierella antarctica]